MVDKQLTTLARLHGIETTLPDRAGKLCRQYRRAC